MYEVLIKLYYELQYRKFTIEELTEIKEILKQFSGKTEEVKVKRLTKQIKGVDKDVSVKRV